MDKKTVLNDDAVIYKKHSDTVTKEQLKEMSKKDKWQYFKDYYLKIVIVVIIAVVFVGYIIKDAVFNKVEEALSIAIVTQDTYIDSDILMENLYTDLGLDSEKEKIYINVFNKNEAYSQMAEVTQIGAGTIDVIIMDEEKFNSYTSNAAFMDLSIVFSSSEYSELKENIVMESIKEVDYNGNIIKTEEEKPYGIKISGNNESDGIITGNNDVYIGIMSSTKKIENAKECVINLIKYIK